MKSSYPQTYDYLYQLIKEGTTSIGDLAKIEERKLGSLFTDEFSDDMDSVMYLEKADSTLLSKFLADPQTFALQLQDHLTSRIIDTNKGTLEEIFEAAENQYYEEYPWLKPESDYSEWRRADSRARFSSMQV